MEKTRITRLGSFFLAFLIVCAVTSYSQNPLTDSLLKIAQRVSSDSAAKLYVKVANIFTGVNSDSVRKYANIAYKLAKPNSVAKGDVLVQYGNSYHMESKMDSALVYYNKALIYFVKIKNDRGVGKAYQSFALVKKSMGDLKGSIDDSKKALEIYKKINWSLGVVNVLNNLSQAYASIQPTLSLQYARQSLSFAVALNDSLKYFSIMAEYGGRLARYDKFDSAIYYISRAKSFLERNKMYNLLIPIYSNLSVALYSSTKGNILKSKEALGKAFYYSSLSGATDNLRYLYKDYSLLMVKEKKEDSAIFYFNKTIDIIDSAHLRAGLDASKELQTKYETEKKELQIKNQSLEIDSQEKQNKQKSLIILLGSLALVGSGFFGSVAFINFRKTKKANVIIENQRQEVEHKNTEITHQKELVEEKQKEIIDSINYAQRIQQAVLTGEDVWNKISKESFIVFKPRDIVSGDFYWAHVLPNGRAIFALADCTGHGVPGGFMSMLGNAFLNELVVENKLFKADEILNRLREKVIAALLQKGQSNQKDGMDMALCVWNKMDNTLEFAGANNSLYLVRENELLEYRGDKMPIGTYLEENKKFTAQKIQLQTNDFIYLSTDGFADQFGGPKGKKLKYKKLEKLLVEQSLNSAQQQKQALENAFNDWKSNYEQTDDVSVVGVKVI